MKSDYEFTCKVDGPDIRTPIMTSDLTISTFLSIELRFVDYTL
jgi:hypothetical protein